MSIQYLPQYGYYRAEIGRFAVYDSNRQLAMQRLLCWFAVLQHNPTA